MNNVLIKGVTGGKPFGLKYYADLNDAPVTDILRQANNKTKNHLMDFSDSSWQYCPDTVISTGAYIMGGDNDIIHTSTPELVTHTNTLVKETQATITQK